MEVGEVVRIPRRKHLGPDDCVYDGDAKEDQKGVEHGLEAAVNGGDEAVHGLELLEELGEAEDADEPEHLDRHRLGFGLKDVEHNRHHRDEHRDRVEPVAGRSAA